MTAAALEDPDVRSVVDRYRTAELATLSRSGAPIAWPATPLYRPESNTIATTPDGHESLTDWWLRIWSRQPNGLALGADPVTRRLMDRYYRRLVITVAAGHHGDADPRARPAAARGAGPGGHTRR